MKILITGATGFVGSRVLQKLLMKYSADSVIALSSQKIEGIDTIDAKGYDFDSRYLTENGAQDVEILLHIGAYIPKATSDADNLSSTTANIVGTQCILNSELPKLRKIVFISTVDVYEDTADVTTEKTAVFPQTMYGWSKLYCEKMIQAYCKQHNCAGVVLRLGHVYGEGEERYRKVMPVMIRNAIEGKDLLIYGDGKAIRSFIYIDDVAEAIVQAIALDDSQVINVVGNETVTINELAELIKGFSRKDIQIKHVESATHNRDYLFDNSLLRKLLIPELIPLKTGLLAEYNYMVKKYEDHI